MAKSDGRYRRTLVSSSLNKPTSLVVDPEHGLMFWSDAGEYPKIEMAWMDGTKRKVIVKTEIERPDGLAIDFAMDHMLYWVDTKRNTIESMDKEGKRRHVIAQGGSVIKPVSVDVFESNMYWINGNGDVIQQDKFGRGVPVYLAKNLPNPKSLKVVHNLRYNMTLLNPCRDGATSCSHLCVLIPDRGARCQCPDGQDFVDRDQNICDAGKEIRTNEYIFA